jgi:hypothetical protein
MTGTQAVPLHSPYAFVFLAKHTFSHPVMLSATKHPVIFQEQDFTELITHKGARTTSFF